MTPVTPICPRPVRRLHALFRCMREAGATRRPTPAASQPALPVNAEGKRHLPCPFPPFV